MSNSYSIPHNQTSILQEAFTAYLSKSNANNTTSIGMVNQLFGNKMQIVIAIRKGISYSFFSSIQLFTPFNETDWSEFLNISTKTLQRYKKSKTHVFKPIHSEKIIELLEVTTLGLAVFETKEKFNKWLNTTSLALGKLKPTDLLKNSYGKELVIDELHRIDHGIFA